MKRTLQQTVEGVYAAFRDVPRPRTIEGCPHCLERPGVNVLLKKPLRELMPEDLMSYVSSALLTLGTADDYCYFLPRILELLGDHANCWYEPEVVGRAIYDAGFETWREDRRHAVQQFFDAVFDDLLTPRQSRIDIDRWLCTLGRVGIDLAPYLERILHSGPVLIDFFEWNAIALEQGGLTNGFWNDAPAARQQVMDWFTSAETKAAIDQQYGAMWNVDPKGLRPS